MPEQGHDGDRVPEHEPPLLVLARIDRLSLLGKAPDIVLTHPVLQEVRDKNDIATERVDALALTLAQPVDPVIPAGLDVSRSLGRGERSVLAWALATGPGALCVLDDAAARAEARRLGLALTGTLGLILEAKREGRLPAAAPILAEAVAAGLYLDDTVLTVALARIGESWPGI